MHKREHVTALRIDARAGLIVIACCAAWGFNQVAIKIANQGISPMLQAGLRSAIAAVIVLAWAMLRGIPLFQRDRDARTSYHRVALTDARQGSCVWADGTVRATGSAGRTASLR